MRVLVSAGEASGDEHAALVVGALRLLEPKVQVRGMAGEAARRAGVELDVDYASAAGVLGFAAPAKNSFKLYSAYRQLTQLLFKWRPDVLVLINFSDFNLRLAKRAKEQGVRTLFYIPPQLWAWRSDRIKTIASSVDIVASIFPFERDFYLSRGYKDVVYVGHPFVDIVRERKVKERECLLNELGMDPGCRYFVFYPGSRTGEVKRHLHLCIETFLKIRSSGLEGAIAVAPSQSVLIEQQKGRLPEGLHLVYGDAFDVMSHAHAGLIKSGTSNLQAAFALLPFSMFFQIDSVSAAIVRRLVKTKDFSIVNLIREGSVREMVQSECEAGLLAQEARRLIDDEGYRNRLREGYKEVIDGLSAFDPFPMFSGSTSAAERVARLVRLLSGSASREIRDELAATA